jgi:hypothetical protein
MPAAGISFDIAVSSSFLRSDQDRLDDQVPWTKTMMGAPIAPGSRYGGASLHKAGRSENPRMIGSDSRRLNYGHTRARLGPSLRIGVWYWDVSTKHALSP